jgi:hypothetical protein
MQDTIDKINNYLQVGGLFNPELMEHHKVRDLLLECRDIFESQNKRKSTLPQIDLDVIMDAYAFTVADDGVVWGLTAGDMGYENTGITIPVEDLQAWAKYNYKPKNDTSSD